MFVFVCVRVCVCVCVCVRACVCVCACDRRATQEEEEEEVEEEEEEGEKEEEEEEEEEEDAEKEEVVGAEEEGFPGVPNEVIAGITNGAKLFANKKSTLGLKWKDAGHEQPSTGTEIKNELLAAALQKRVKFKKEEWEKIQVANLRSDSYIKAGNRYFIPAGTKERQGEKEEKEEGGEEAAGEEAAGEERQGEKEEKEEKEEGGEEAAGEEAAGEKENFPEIPKGAKWASNWDTREWQAEAEAAKGKCAAAYTRFGGKYGFDPKVVPGNSLSPLSLLTLELSLSLSSVSLCPSVSRPSFLPPSLSHFFSLPLCLCLSCFCSG